ncbi:MAG TPA: NTF2 fold immunity protein [Stellaceae bacterium]|nr:NTF2 fold immunity protein [Stellaceae bacterium]
MTKDSETPSDEGLLFFTKAIHGGLVFSSDLAEKIAELLFEAHYGKEELARQRPLLVRDKDTYWRIEGSWNREGKINGRAELFVSIDKYNGRVTNFGGYARLQPHPSVVPILQQHFENLKGKKSDGDK